MSPEPRVGDILVVTGYCRAGITYHPTWVVGRTFEVYPEWLAYLDEWYITYRPATPDEEALWRLGG